MNKYGKQTSLHHPIQQVIVDRINSIDVSSTGKCFHFISCLNEASQNFQPAMEAIGHQVFVILPFIEKLIQVYYEQLKTELSPAEKNEISHQLHCSIQAVIFCSKNCLNNNKRYNFNRNLGSALTSINVKCLELIDNPDIPMDTKNICAILVVMESLISDKLTSEYLFWIKDNSNIKKLSLIFGIITTMDQKQMNYKILADVSTVLKEIYLETSIDPTLLMSACSSFMELTRKLKDQRIICHENFNSVISSALFVALLNVEHHMDSVRHRARETLKHLVETSVSNNNDILLERIFLEIDKLSSVNLRCSIIVSISPVLKAEQILRQQRNILLFEEILCSVTDNKVANQNLINCYEVVAQKLSEEVDFDKWFKKIVKPALNSMMGKEKLSEERLTIENLLLKLINKDVKVLEEILKQRETFDIGFLFMCLSAGKKAGRFDKETSTADQWKGIISYEKIKNAMIHVEDKIRNSAFLMIVEARKSTEGFSEQELDCVKHFLKYNINVQSPSTRQSILGMLKNLFARIQTVSQAALKKKEVVDLEFYFNFLVHLQEFCLENLVEGSNFTRRKLSLLILHYISKIIGENYPDKSSTVWDGNKLNVLMNVMNDSYEANKENVVEIMKLIPNGVVRQFCKISLRELQVAVTSIRPPDSLTAIYLLEIITKFTFNFDEFPAERSEVSPESLLVLTWCENLLMDGLALAEKSLTVASSTNPLYGLVQSIRHLLSKLDLKTLGVCQLWRNFFQRLIPVCKRLTLVVAPVVNNSSPEGILPEENFDNLDEQTKEEWKKIADQTTPQIVLLCSWRTIKEVSLLLGDICLRAPLKVEGEGDGLLDVDQIISIGDHFLELLSQTKHRGAFEQCYFGFSQLCLRLWTCNEPKLHRLPSEMLNEMISSISGEDKGNNELLSMKNLCATRRSAGLPFMIQPLITAELKVSSTKNFHFVMTSLIKFCRHGEHLETRTHSLNILRALFRCSDLNEAISEYNSDGIKCSILGYGAESWIEKNSATLLFSALMVRIFGVQRTKDSEDLNIKNKMRARIFFLRYPDLYDFFMTQLTEAAQFVANEKMNSKLQPILLLLNRLYPSALEGTQTKLELVNFVPVVSLCSGCVVMPTRILCAKFIANVTPLHLLTARILETIKVLKGSDRLPSNAAHGILLQIFHLAKLIPMMELGEGTSSKLIPILDEICPIGQRFKSQLVCFGAFVDIVTEICLKCWLVFEAPCGEPLSFMGTRNDVEKWLSSNDITEAQVQQGQQLLGYSNHDLNALQHLNLQKHENYKSFSRYLESCFGYDKSALFGSSIVTPKIFIVKLMMCNLGDPSEFFNSLVDSQATAEDDFPLKLNLILLLLDIDYATSMQDEYEINPKEIFVIKNMRVARRFELKSALMYSEELKARLLQRSLDYQVMVKSLDVLSFLHYSDGYGEAATVFIESSLNKPEQLKKSFLRLANLCVKTEKSIAHIDFKFLPDISTDPSYYVK